MKEPLKVTISGYPTTITRADDGSVKIEIEVGFPVGTREFDIPAAESRIIGEYISAPAK